PALSGPRRIARSGSTRPQDGALLAGKQLRTPWPREHSIVSWPLPGGSTKEWLLKIRYQDKARSATWLNHATHQSASKLPREEREMHAARLFRTTCSPYR